MKTIVIFKNKKGIDIIAEIVDGNISLDSAKARFDSELFTVSSVKEFIPGNRTKKDMGALINSEGLGYAVQDHSSYDIIKNKTLAMAWLNAELALNQVQNNVEYE